MKSANARFDEKFNKAGPAECWLWTAGCFRRGYGAFGVGGKLVKAHRYSWEREHGPIPYGALVCHRCDTPACVNPAHLFLGTNLENVRDRDSKGRQARQAGERNAMSKLTAKEISEIRAATSVSQTELGRIYGVAQSCISRIRSGARWPDGFLTIKGAK